MSETTRSVASSARWVIAIALLFTACDSPDVTSTPSATPLNVGGVPVSCAPQLEADDCLDRAQTGILSLPSEHPEVTSLTVTCDADRCDRDEGVGRVIVRFADGTHEVIDIGFGHTNSDRFVSPAALVVVDPSTHNALFARPTCPRRVPATTSPSRRRQQAT